MVKFSVYFDRRVFVMHSENGSTRKHAIGKRRVVPENIDHFSKTFPLEPLRNIFQGFNGELQHCKDTSNAPEETKFR